jgi:putative phosphoserine phosphatase/1-acylglycerol-3-phosphate O-acyltransferase
MSLAERIEEIRNGPAGARIGAFFDYDGTVISGFSAEAFYRHRIRQLEIGPREALATLVAAVRGVRDAADFSAFLDMSLQSWAGRTVEELEKLSQKIFDEQIASHVHPEVWQLAEVHRRMGHTIVIASSATRFQIDPMARELGADVALYTEIEEVDGVVTGRHGRTLWGDGKAAAVRETASERDIDLASSYGYSNGDEDVPFLEAVGRPCAVGPENELRRIARERAWPILDVARHGRLEGVVDIARTLGFYGGMAAAAGTGLGLGLLNRSRKQLVEIAGGVGTDLGLALAGVNINIERGEEHLWSARPCLFVFNHRSKLDAIVLMNLLRRDFTGVAKKEAANVPGFGQLFQLAGVAFIDRGNTGQAKKALEPAVQKLRDEGTSLVIAPEGTRARTKRLGPFKKGAFHIAMQAGVPMVPIVLRNVDELMWRDAQTIHSGTIDVAVLPPVDTSSWQVETIEDHVAEVRQMFLDTLADWPGAERPAPPPASKPTTNGSGDKERVGR